MDTAGLLKKVRKIGIRSRGLSDQIFSGHYLSAFKGHGMAFNEVREYHYGDAIRDIDWNVTARFNSPFVKIYNEERELLVMLLVDVSASNLAGSGNAIKQDRITEITALLSYSALKNNDKVGVIFFSKKIEKFIPPGKGTQHVMLIIRELVNFKPENNKTNIAKALRFLSKGVKKRCTAFLISDFIDDNYEEALKITAGKHDIVGLNIYDPVEQKIKIKALINTLNPETGNVMWIDTASKKDMDVYTNAFQSHMDKTKNIFLRSGIDFTAISTTDDYVKSLIMLFKNREARR